MPFKWTGWLYQCSFPIVVIYTLPLWLDPSTIPFSSSRFYRGLNKGSLLRVLVCFPHSPPSFRQHKQTAMLWASQNMELLLALYLDRDNISGTSNSHWQEKNVRTKWFRQERSSSFNFEGLQSRALGKSKGIPASHTQTSYSLTPPVSLNLATQA